MTVLRDDSGFPFVCVRPVGRSRDADIAENLAFLDRCFDRKERFVALFDAREAEGLSAVQRRMYADYFARREASIVRYFRGGATVSRSPVVHASIRGMFWLYPPPFPFRVTLDLGEAEIWLRSRLGRVSNAPIAP